MFSYYIDYICNGKKFVALSEDTPHFKIKSSYANGRFTAEMHTTQKIIINKFQVIFPYKYKENQKCFVNGYQSWTDSKEYLITEKMTELTRLKEAVIKLPSVSKSGVGRSGDVLFYKYPRKKGVFYGYSYGYLRDDKNVDLFASLSEMTGYTIIKFNAGKSQVIAEKDFDGVTFQGESSLIDFVHLKGEYEDVFDRWFSLMDIKCRSSEKKSGYTTWYNYYRNIDENIVRRDLKSLSNLKEKVDIFQIDDGYQKSIGDWLNTDEKKFPDGMKIIADEIHKNNMLAGLWLAPFAATKESFIYQKHRDWLICDDKGEPYTAGHNWNGFYAIDFYNQEAAAYIKKVFKTILYDWGYDMVKLDFLYAACLLPIHNKSRGQIMCEAMDFIRECVGDKMILGCGVPLMPAFGKVDFCRIGEDVALEWKHKRHMLREDVSTPNTINCTIFRRGLNGRAFLNDPDVFLLRDSNMVMTFEQRKLLAKINSIFGSLLFVSDNVADYDRRQLDVFEDTIRKKDIKIIKAEFCKKDIICVEYTQNGDYQSFKFNYQTGKLY